MEGVIKYAQQWAHRECFSYDRARVWDLELENTWIKTNVTNYKDLHLLQEYGAYITQLEGKSSTEMASALRKGDIHIFFFEVEFLLTKFQRIWKKMKIRVWYALLLFNKTCLI